MGRKSEARETRSGLFDTSYMYPRQRKEMRSSIEKRINKNYPRKKNPQVNHSYSEPIVNAPPASFDFELGPNNSLIFSQDS